MPAIVEDVVYQHAENVCSLWLQRQNAVEEPHYSFADLVHLDNRVEANLEGLRVAGVHCLPFIDELIKAEDEGAYFAKSILALETGDSNAFNAMIEEAEKSQQIRIEIESALAWAKPDYLKDIVKTLLTSENSAPIILGLKACASHSRDPGSYIQIHFKNKDPLVRAAALRVGADLGSRGFANTIPDRDESETEEERFEQGRALSLLGNQKAAWNILSQIALSNSTYSTQAVNLLMQSTDPGASKSLLKSLDGMEGRERDVVRGFGLLGDPVAMGWLIEKTEIPELSRLSGGSISMITGIDLAEEDLETLNEPEGFEDGGINDNPDDSNVALEEDEDLPWPNPELVSAWWNSSAKLPAGKMFLNGREKVHAELREVLVTGMQRQRNAAAVSLAMLSPESKYLDTRLPTGKQKLWMS